MMSDFGMENLSHRRVKGWKLSVLGQFHLEIRFSLKKRTGTICSKIEVDEAA